MTLGSIWQSVWHHRAEGPGIRLTAAFDTPAAPEGIPQECLSVTIANTGPVPVAVGSVKLRVMGDAEQRSLFPADWMHAQPPQPLPVGDTWTAPLVPVGTIRAELAKYFPDVTNWELIAVVNDLSGVEYSDDIDLTPRSH